MNGDHSRRGKLECVTAGGKENHLTVGNGGAGVGGRASDSLGSCARTLFLFKVGFIVTYSAQTKANFAGLASSL